VFPEEPAPNAHVPILYFGEPTVQVLFLGVGFGVGKEAVEVRRIGFVLPMMLEGVEVGGWGGRGLDSHDLKVSWDDTPP
jgi:hypothetical protein